MTQGLPYIRRHFDGTMRIEIGEYQHLTRCHARLILRPAFKIQRERASAKTLRLKRKRNLVALTADRPEIAFKTNDRKTDAARIEKIRIGDAQRIGEPVFDQTIEQHQILREEYDSRRVAMRETDAR